MKAARAGQAASVMTFSPLQQAYSQHKNRGPTGFRASGANKGLGVFSFWSFLILPLTFVRVWGLKAQLPPQGATTLQVSYYRGLHMPQVRSATQKQHPTPETETYEIRIRVVS